MSSGNCRTVIRLLGNDYSIISNQSEEFTQRVAFYVDKKLNEVLNRNKRLSTNLTAILASVNLAEDCLKLQDENEVLKKEAAEATEKFEMSKAKITDLRNKNETLNNEIQRLKIEIARLEALKGAGI